MEFQKVGTKWVIFEFSKLDLSSYFAMSVDLLDQENSLSPFQRVKALEKSRHWAHFPKMP